MDISVRDMGNEELYHELKTIGYAGVDISFPGWGQHEKILDANFEYAFLNQCKIITNAGLKICQMHLTYYPGHFDPLGDGSYASFEECLLPILTKELKIAAKTGCCIVVLHPYFDASAETSRAGNIRLIEKVMPVLENSGIVLCLENIYSRGFGEAFVTAADDLLYYPNYFGSEHIGICLDTGHAVARNQNPIDMLKRLGKTVKGLHIHSNVPGMDLHLPPALIGNVDWKAFSDTLKGISYKGTFNMEITAPKLMNMKAAIAYYEMAYNTAKGLLC